MEREERGSQNQASKEDGKDGACEMEKNRRIVGSQGFKKEEELAACSQAEMSVPLTAVSKESWAQKQAGG